MGTYIVVDDATGIISNRIVLDDPGQWEVSAGHTLVEEIGEPMAIGGTYIGGVYTPPPAPPPPEPPPPAPPTAEQSILFDHENRILVMEGYEPLTIEEFMDKLG